MIGPNEIVLSCTDDVVRIGEDCYIKVREALPDEPVDSEAEELFETCADCVNGEGGVPPDEDKFCLTTWNVTYNCGSGFGSITPGTTVCDVPSSTVGQWVKLTDQSGQCTYAKQIQGSKCTGTADCTESDPPSDFPDLNDPALDCNACDTSNNVCEYVWEVSWNCAAAPGSEAGTVVLIDANCAAPGTEEQDWEVYNPAVGGGTVCTLRRTTVGQTCSNAGNCNENNPPAAPTTVPEECGCVDKCIEKHTYTYNCGTTSGTGPVVTTICENPNNLPAQGQWILESTDGTTCVLAFYISSVISCDKLAPSCDVYDPIDPPDSLTISNLCNCGGGDTCVFLWEAQWNCATSTWVGLPTFKSYDCADIATEPDLNAWVEHPFDNVTETVPFTFKEAGSISCTSVIGSCLGQEGSAPTLPPAPTTSCPDACFVEYTITYNCDTLAFSTPVATGTKACLDAGTSQEWEFVEKLSNVCTFKTVRSASGYFCISDGDCSSVPDIGIPSDTPSAELLNEENGCDCYSQSPQCVMRWETRYNCVLGTYPDGDPVAQEEVCDDASIYDTSNWTSSCDFDYDGYVTLQIYTVKSGGGTCADFACDGTGHTAPSNPSETIANSICNCPSSRCYQKYIQVWDCDSGSFDFATPIPEDTLCDFPYNVEVGIWQYDASASSATKCVYNYLVEQATAVPCDVGSSDCASRNYGSAPSLNPSETLMQQTCGCYESKCYFSYIACAGTVADDIFVECLESGEEPPRYIKANDDCFERGQQTNTPVEEAITYTDTYASCAECAGPYTMYSECGEGVETIIFNVEPEEALQSPYITANGKCFSNPIGSTGPVDPSFPTYAGWVGLTKPASEEDCLSANNYIELAEDCDSAMVTYFISSNTPVGAGRIIRLNGTGECIQVPLLTCDTAATKVGNTALTAVDFRTGPAGIGQPDFTTCQECINDAVEPPPGDSNDGGGGPPGGGGGSLGSLSSTGLEGSEIVLPSDGGIGSFSETVTPEDSSS
jgi:hypothetical protein